MRNIIGIGTGADGNSQLSRSFPHIFGKVALRKTMVSADSQQKHAGFFKWGKAGQIGAESLNGILNGNERPVQVESRITESLKNTDDFGTVRAFPDEFIGIASDPPSADKAVYPESPQQLRQLSDIPEIVRQVSDLRITSEIFRNAFPLQKIADDGLTMNQTGVTLGVPGTDMHSVPANIGLQFFPAGRPDFQIILQQHGLPVQSELKFRICPQNFQKRIHHVHQADSKRLK